MNIKTSRPLPPTPVTNTPVTKTTEPTTSPVQKTVDSTPPTPSTPPVLKKSLTKPKPLGSPEEQQQIQQQIDKTPPEVMQKNASRLPPISGINPQLIRAQQITSHYRQHMSKMPQNTVKLSGFNTQQSNDVTVESKEVLKMLQKHQQNEFSRQMKMSGILMLPPEVQLQQRNQVALSHQQERANEARELMELRQSQMGTDTSQLSSITGELNNSMKKAAMLMKAEAFSGKSGEAYRELSQKIQQDRQNILGQKQVLIGENSLLSVERNRQAQDLSSVNYQIETTETKLSDLQRKLDFIVSMPPPEERSENRRELSFIKEEMQDYDRHIAKLKENPEMSSLKLKKLMVKKDQLMVNFKKQMQSISENEQLDIQDLRQEIETHSSTLSGLNEQKQSLTSQLETTQQQIQKIDLTQNYLDIQMERKQLEAIGFQMLSTL